MPNGPFLVDLRDVGVNHKGVGRVLTELAPRLLDLAPDRYHFTTTDAGRSLLPAIGRDRLHLAPLGRQSWWEQIELPRTARRIGADAIYSHRDCGALWGPRLLLHVTEDPNVRWSREPHPGSAERARRAYSRVLMNRSLRRARVVTSTTAAAELLARNHGLKLEDTTVVPLAVDDAKFRPPASECNLDRYLFHLASGDPREHTSDVLEAMALVQRGRRDCPQLVIGGGLGQRSAMLQEHASRLGIERQVKFTGYLDDAELVRYYGYSAATLNASSDEGFGLQPLEALACGSLLISVRAPATEEVTRGAVSVMCDAGASAIARAIVHVLDNPSLRREALARNPGVAGQFTWQATAEQLHHLLLELAR